MKRLKIVLVLVVSFLIINQESESVHAQTSQPLLKASIARGKELYLLQCLACHQVDGGGVPHLNAPLDGSANVNGKDKIKLIKIVLKGQKGVEIEGESYSNVMASHQDLSDQQIADILTYVRNSWTNKASAVTATEVKQVRSKLK